MPTPFARRLVALDERLLRIARSRGHDQRAERAVAGYSRLGEHAALWLALGAAGSVLAAPDRRAGWRRATAVVAGTYAANTTLKLIVRRQRPELPGLAPLTSTPTRLSFPSAHASTSFAGALAYSRLGLPAVPLYTLATSLALSRLYLGVHYPSDILAGAALGTVAAALGTGRGEGRQVVASAAGMMANGAGRTMGSVGERRLDAGQDVPRPHAGDAANPRGRSHMNALR